MKKIIVIATLILMFSCRAIYYRHNEQFETVERLLSRDSITFKDLRESGLIDVENGTKFVKDTSSSVEDAILESLNKCYLQNYTIENYGNVTINEHNIDEKYFSIIVQSKTCQSLQGLMFLFYRNSNKISTIVFYPSIL